VTANSFRSRRYGPSDLLLSPAALAPSSLTVVLGYLASPGLDLALTPTLASSRDLSTYTVSYGQSYSQLSSSIYIRSPKQRLLNLYRHSLAYFDLDDHETTATTASSLIDCAICKALA
jgi:hypothetical protein